MARECRAGISAVPRFEFFGRQRLEKCFREATLDQPGLTFPAFLERHQPGDRFARPCDHDFLAVPGAYYELRQMSLGLMNVDLGAHNNTVIGGW